MWIWTHWSVCSVNVNFFLLKLSSFSLNILHCVCLFLYFCIAKVETDLSSSVKECYWRVLFGNFF